MDATVRVDTEPVDSEPPDLVGDVAGEVEEPFALGAVDRPKALAGATLLVDERHVRLTEEIDHGLIDLVTAATGAGRYVDGDRPWPDAVVINHQLQSVSRDVLGRTTSAAVNCGDDRVVSRVRAVD